MIGMLKFSSIGSKRTLVFMPTTVTPTTKGATVVEFGVVANGKNDAVLKIVKKIPTSFVLLAMLSVVGRLNNDCGRKTEAESLGGLLGGVVMFNVEVLSDVWTLFSVVKLFPWVVRVSSGIY